MADPIGTPRVPDTTPGGRGFGAGLFAGVLFVVAAAIAAGVAGESVLLPFRLAASVVLGRSALDQSHAVVGVVVGTTVHLVLSGAFGAVYGVMVGRLSPAMRAARGLHAWLGALYGGVLWLVNVQLVGRAVHPWLLERDQVAMLLSHALAYGVPLGLLYATAERTTLPRSDTGAHRAA